MSPTLMKISVILGKYALSGQCWNINSLLLSLGFTEAIFKSKVRMVLFIYNTAIFIKKRFLRSCIHMAYLLVTQYYCHIRLCLWRREREKNKGMMISREWKCWLVNWGEYHWVMFAHVPFSCHFYSRDEKLLVWVAHLQFIAFIWHSTCSVIDLILINKIVWKLRFLSIFF